MDALERIIGHLDKLRTSPEVADNPDNTEWETLDEALDVCTGLQDEAMQCDCHGGSMGCREYRYFNPSFNYIGKDGKPSDGLTPEEVRKYTRQDYERMESLNSGQWCYIGIRAEAEIIGWHGTVQRITSGGLWGIESNSDREYLKETEQEELANLKTELLALGFSRRAIATAFKNAEEEDA